MKEKSFESELRDQLDGYEVAAPDGLWEAIEGSLPVVETKIDSPQRKSRSGMLLRWAAAAAALLLVGVSTFWLWPSDDKAGQELTASKTSGVPLQEEKESSRDVVDNGSRLLPKAMPMDRSAAPRARQLAQSHGTIAEPAAALTIVEESVSMPAEHDVAAAETSDQPSTKEERESSGTVGNTEPTGISRYEGVQTAVRLNRERPSGSRPTVRKQSERTRLTASIYAGNLVRGQRIDSQPVMMSSGGDVMHQLDYTSAAGKRMVMGTVYDFEERTEYHHPVKFGLSVAYAWSERFRVQTGVVCQKVMTDLIQRMRNVQLITENEYLYIGVPLKVSYDVWRNKAVRIYGVAGAEADFNVKARQRLQQLESEAKKDKVQWAADGGVGLQLDVVPRLGVFVESGVVYYLDNHSGVDNIFKDKPLNWNLEFGIRLDLR